MNKIEHILLNINKIIVDKNLNRSRISKDLNINRTTLYNYLDNKTSLSVEFLINICDYLNVNVSSVLNETTNTQNDIDIEVFLDELKNIVKERISNKK